MTKNKKIVLGFLVLALVVGVGAMVARADLTVAALTITSSGALTLEGAAASAITVGALNTGGISIGGGNTAKTINLGTGTAIDTINIGTGATGVDVITIGGATSGTTIAGTLTLSGGQTATNTALATLGTLVGTTGLNMSANTGRAMGLQVNLQNTANTVTGFRAIDARVTDAGGTAAEVVGVQGLGTKSSGDGATGNHSLWGGNFIASLSGGQTSNIYGVYGDASAATGTTVKGASNCAVCFINGVQGLGRASAGATTTGVLISGVTGIIGQTSGDKKGDAAVLALLEGQLSQATTGTVALFKGGNYNSGVNPDYGLDFKTTVNSVVLSFNNADVRLASGAEIMSGTSTNPETDNVTCTTLGSLYLSTGAGGTTWHCTVAGVGAAATWVAI